MTKSRLQGGIFLLLFLVLLPHHFSYSQQEKKIRGKVTAEKQPLENVKIAVSDEVLGVTDAQGAYEIRAAVGDILVYSHLGMKPVKILVEDVTEIININMEPEVEQLSEVVVSKRKRRDLKAEYPTNENIVKTSFGYIDRATSSGNVKVLSKDKIRTPSNFCILDVLRGKFAAVRVIGDCYSGGVVVVRSTPSINNPGTAIFDVDGQILTDAPIWIPPENIERVAVLIGFASTVMYGSAAASGVVVINTRTGITETTFKVDEPNTRYNPNVYQGDALSFASVSQNNGPTYLKELYASKDPKAARERFKSLSKEYSNTPFFFLDAFEYFVQKWNKKGFALEIINENYHLFEKNPVLLKALAYLLEDNGFFDRSNEIYREVIKLRPQYLQSYFDLANSNLRLNNTKRALELYLRFNDLVDRQFFYLDSLELKPFYEREVKSVFALYPKYYFTAMVDNEAREDFSPRVTRLVFEWNDNEAEFELQFVGPNDGYSNWMHTTAQNSERIIEEKQLGYSMKDFIIDDSMPGEWKINLKYIGNKSLTPTYLKVRIYDDYGSPIQTETLEVFKLTTKGVNQELFSIFKQEKQSK